MNKSQNLVEVTYVSPLSGRRSGIEDNLIGGPPSFWPFLVQGCPLLRRGQPSGLCVTEIETPVVYQWMSSSSYCYCGIERPDYGSRKEGAEEEEEEED